MRRPRYGKLQQSPAARIDRVRGAAELVDGDAVVDGQAGLLGQLHVRLHADAHQHHVGVDAAAVLQLGATDAVAVGQQAAQRHAFAQIDTVRAMQRAEVVRGGRRGHALQDARRRFEQRHLQALAGRHGRSLQPDVAAADHQQPPAGHQVRRHRVGIGQAAHQQHALQLAADVGRQAARPRAGEQHQPAVFDMLAAVQPQAPRSAVDARHARAQAQLDLLLLVPGGGADQDLLHRQRIGQVLLRQRRPVVGQHRLVADQQQAAFEAGAAHAVDESRGRMAATHQHHRAP